MLKNIIILLNKKMELKTANAAPAVISEKFTDPETSLVITDSKKILHQAKQDGYAVLFQSSSDEFIKGADYVTDSLEEADYEYLNMVFSRQKKIPLDILETGRTYVREMTVEDLPALYDLYDDDEIRRYIEPLYNYEKEKEFTLAYIKNMYGFYGFGLWLVFSKKTDALIGRVGLSIREVNGKERVELGYVIGKEYRRQAYAVETAGAVLKYAQEKLNIEDIVIITEKDNEASIKTAEKLGFVRDGIIGDEEVEYLLFEKNDKKIKKIKKGY